MADFTYKRFGEWVRVYPNTPAAEKCWSEEISPQTLGTGEVLERHFLYLRGQLEAAGYTLRAWKRPAREPGPRNCGLRDSDQQLLLDLGL